MEKKLFVSPVTRFPLADPSVKGRGRNHARFGFSLTPQPATTERTRVLSHVFVSVWLYGRIFTRDDIEESMVQCPANDQDVSFFELITRLRDSRSGDARSRNRWVFPRECCYSRLSYPNIYSKIQMRAFSRTRIMAYYDKRNYALCKLSMYFNVIMKY